ncbi:hypothetical protein [Methylobacterium dankookense]|uniref:hypothetical protein n=1 Tax=Methylobacterium dankookense TaxID=560405 RepID=UPI0011A91DA9|nr:hypothetical protein [Methylobacterium dankookense]
MEKRASPIIYADALPITIKNAVANKAVLRAAVPDHAIAAHVEHIFSHEAVIKRVGLVLLSGLGDQGFRRSVAHFEAACEARGIPVLEVPFFYGTNMPKIRATLTPEILMQIRTIMDGFREGQPLIAA